MRKRARRSGSPSSGPSCARSGRSASVAVPIVADDELLGLISAEGTTEVDLARAAANQTAVAIKKIELIERLTEKNLIKDFFEQLAGGNVLGAVEGRAARLGCDLDRRTSSSKSRRPTTRSRRRSRALDSGFPVRPPRRLAAGRSCAFPRPARPRSSSGSRRSMRRSEPSLDRDLEPLHGGGQLPGRLRGGRARAARLGHPRDTRCDDLRGARRRTSTSCACRSIRRSATPSATLIAKIAEYDRQRQTLAPSHARGVPPPARQHQRDRRGAVRPSEHAQAAPSAHPGDLRARPPQGGLAPDRDRREDGQAPGRLGTVGTAHKRRRTLVGSRHRQAQRA